MASINTTLKIDILEADDIVEALQRYRLDLAKEMYKASPDGTTAAPPEVRNAFGRVERLLREFGVPLRTLTQQDIEAQTAKSW